MKQAFLFDMDGVLVNSEQVWQSDGKAFEEAVFGGHILEKVGDTTGITLEKLYTLAKQHGFAKSLQQVTQLYDEFIEKIYAKTIVAPGLSELLQALKDMQFSVGIVSSSRKLWIEYALRKIPNKEAFDLILSLDEKRLPSKPSPAGYQQAMQYFATQPAATIILEDSNAGIAAGLASGAFVIAFTPFLVKGYQQIQADAKAGSFKEVLEIVDERVANLYKEK